jgi:hypothetical protein
MTDLNEENRPPTTSFQPLPEIEDQLPLSIAADVDRLFVAVMEKAKVSEARYQERVGQFELREDPIRFLTRKTHFLRTLLREGRSGKEKETWEETWKDLLHPWFTTLMRLAVYDPDPTFNRWFLEPALRASGYY